ncbi:efflux RND transporter permease subunit [Luteithermobacter gelatinilyticus]|uniref:efflux RND transporter permease subunit n=1 Tax=Luteithermobacter gelatinilyticus TaxID=2582913 RepID=UPI001105F247|nr:MMPL family transporter [Luteithermobacter gelatinilyticus]
MILLSESAARSPKKYFWISGLLSVLLILLVALPTLMPDRVPFLAPLKIDTDPENMLSEEEPVRVFHNAQKKDFSLYDMVVVGVVNDRHDQGVFNPRTLAHVYDLANFAKTLSWTDENGTRQGVISVDLMAPNTVDNIEPGGPGVVKFDYLMPTPPKTDEEALAVRDKARKLPLLNGTLISEGGNALALYVPITAKDVSYDVVQQLKGRIAGYDAEEQYYITGMPVAQDTFGVEMFKQMAISAPLAMLLIFLLMWYFFKRVTLVISPMIVAMVSVIVTMGLLVITGNTVHIMSSMIPIFIMPIAVLDSIHILSDFYDTYPKYRDRYKTLRHVMEELSRPMLYTSLTTAVGFGSLALTPIPPVQVFGIFVAIGVLLAWFFTITLIPAYIMMMSDEKLAGFGMGSADATDRDNATPLARLLKLWGRGTYAGAKLILLGLVVLGVGAWYGITQIVINDNPVKWFDPDHEIRIADKALNERFAGTYMAYLLLQDKTPPLPYDAYVKELSARLAAKDGAPYQVLAAELPALATQARDRDGLIDLLSEKAEAGWDNAPDADYEQWEAAYDFVETLRTEDEIFKKPEVLRYMSALQDYLLETGLVGKSNSLADMVKTVHRELQGGEADGFRIPDTPAAVAQTLLTFQNSHRPDDLWHFVTPDYQKSSLWLQLKSGDNRDMSALHEAVARYMAAHPAPEGLEHDWFGLTHINVIWQQKMVAGMAEAFIGSFIIVLIMMAVLFRSLLWAVLAMVPLTFTIGMIYGIIGLIGKDYDMPVAVLSSLSLGLAVDYAIHFLARSREMRKRFANWRETSTAVFGEPARAIARNVIVVGIGFLPLLAAPLVPYQTVGTFISAILVLAGIATLTILPALVRLLEPFLFKKQKERVTT